MLNSDLKAQIEELKLERQQLILMLNRHRPTCIVRTDSVKTPESEANPLLEQLEAKWRCNVFLEFTFERSSQLAALSFGPRSWRRTSRQVLLYLKSRSVTPQNVDPIRLDSVWAVKSNVSLFLSLAVSIAFQFMFSMWDGAIFGYLCDQPTNRQLVLMRDCNTSWPMCSRLLGCFAFDEMHFGNQEL